MSDEGENACSISSSRPEDEALRLKDLAEENYASGDLKSALNHANRAHCLYPSLDGLPELITSFEVLQAAADHPFAPESISSNQIPPPDYYRILQVERFSHPNAIKKQYKKLALTLHPDKNPSPASAEAFKLVGEASRVLSDKIRRKEYDMRLRISMHSEASQEVGPVEGDNFWSLCSVCGLVHQYERKFLGHNLVCPRCKKSFKAVEVDKESANSGVDVEKSPTRISTRIKEQFAENGSLVIVEKCGLRVKRKFSSVNEVLERSEIEMMRTKKFVNGEASNEAEDKSRTTRAAGKVRDGVERESQSDEMNMLESDRAQRAKAWEEDNMTLSQMKNLAKKVNRKVEENLAVKGNKRESEKVKEREENTEEEKTLKVYTRRARKNNSVETVNIFTSEKDNLEVLQEESAGEKEKETDGKREKRERKRISKYRNPEPNRRKKSRNQADLEFERFMAKKMCNLEIMPVEDSDFHDFDRDRKGSRFRKGQVWAVYDDDDGMPRHYVLIEKIISTNPFEVNLSWLLFQTKGNEKITRQRNMGLHVSCGSFKVSRRVSIKYLKLFSHVVDCERAAREVYRIYPAKGSVWALYGDKGGEDKNRGYDIVVCLSSYSEVYGLSVGYLEKVPGYRTVFKRREIGTNGVVNLGKDGVKSFSHQIPAKKLSGEEACGLPKDSWELDPASLAPHLLIET